MKMKKYTAMLLVTAFILSMALAGCNSTNGTAAEVSQPAGTETPTASSEAVAATSDEVQPQAQSSNPEQSPVDASVTYPLDTNISLSLYIPFNSRQESDLVHSFNDSKFWQTTQVNTGVDIEFIEISQAAYSEQFSLMMASSDYPDMIASFAQYYIGSLEHAIEENIIIDVSKYFEYAPDYKTVIDSNINYQRDTMTDSGAVGVFYTIDSTPMRVDVGAYVRQDWLDKLGLSTPVTLNDMENVLEAFKVDLGVEMPVFIGSNAGNIAPFYSAYDINALYSDMGGVALYQIDGRVAFAPFEKGFDDAVTMLNRWYEKGYFSTDFTTLDSGVMPTSNDISSAISTGVTGVFVGTTDTANDLTEAGKAADPNWSFTAIASPVLEEGQMLHTGISPMTAVDGNGISISGNCKNPEIAAMFCNYFYTEEGSMLRSFGIQGETYEIGEDGEPYFLEFFFKNPDYSRGQIMYNYFLSSEVGLIQENRFSSTKPDNWSEIIEIWNSNMDNAYILTGFYSMSAEESERYTALSTEIATYLEESVLKFIVGEKPLSELDSFRDELKKLGSEEMLSLVQSAYDRYLARIPK